MELRSEVISRMPNCVCERSLTLAVHLELKCQRIQIRRSHLRRPPQARMREHQLGKLIRREGHVFRFIRSKLHFLFELDAFNLPSQRAFDAASVAFFNCAVTVSCARSVAGKSSFETTVA